MRALLLLGATLTVGCDLGPVIDYDLDDSGDASCPQAGWVPASDARMSITGLSVDGLTLLGGFDPDALYETGPAACVDPAGGGVALTFAVGGDPFGTVTMIAPTTGGLTVGADGTFEVVLFAADPPVTFTNAHWVLGSWDVQSLEPFAVTVSGAQGQNNGRYLDLAFTAEASP